MILSFIYFNIKVTFTLDNLLTDELYKFTIVSYTDYPGGSSCEDDVVPREKSTEFMVEVRTRKS